MNRCLFGGTLSALRIAISDSHPPPEIRELGPKPLMFLDLSAPTSYYIGAARCILVAEMSGAST
jgi:hypothetical protein